jgi:hypothetical protein
MEHKRKMQLLSSAAFSLGHGGNDCNGYYRSCSSVYINANPVLNGRLVRCCITSESGVLKCRMDTISLLFSHCGRNISGGWCKQWDLKSKVTHFRLQLKQLSINFVFYRAFKNSWVLHIV